MARARISAEEYATRRLMAALVTEGNKRVSGVQRTASEVMAGAAVVIAVPCEAVKLVAHVVVDVVDVVKADVLEGVGEVANTYVATKGRCYDGFCPGLAEEVAKAHQDATVAAFLGELGKSQGLAGAAKAAAAAVEKLQKGKLPDAPPAPAAPAA